MPQGKNYREFLSNTKKKSQVLKKFIEYLTHENTRKDLMGRTTLNIEKDTVLISQSQQQSLFTSNQKEAVTRIALHFSESSKPVLVKAKDIDILILMVYAFALTSPPYGWYLQIDNGKIVSVKKVYGNFGKTTSLCFPQFHSLTDCDTVIHFFGISKTFIFQRLLRDTSATHLIEKIGESAIVSKDLLYQVISFIQKYVYRGKVNEELVKTRMRQYSTMETKRTQTISPDPHSLKEHIKRANLQAYYWQHYLEHNITKEDPCRAGWLRDETNGLKPFWYECRQLPSSMKEKRKSQAKGKEVDLVKQSTATDERPQRLSAVVAKIQMNDISPDEEELEESDNNDTDFASESDSSVQIFTKGKLFHWFIYI